MLLQSILQELDGELARLHALRDLVVELGQTPIVVAQINSSPAVDPTPEEPVLASILPLIETARPERKVRADAGKQRAPRMPKPAPASESRALARSVPSGPVVFTATQLAEEKARREQTKESQTATSVEATAEDLDALSRSLAARWSTGLVQ